VLSAPYSRAQGTVHEQHDADLPWEAEDVVAPSEPAPTSMALGPLSSLMLSGIRFYQVEIGPNSVARCPYLVSCSQFAKQALARYGFFGLPMFIDRFFYRENQSTFALYPRYMSPSGVLRYDDTIRDE
jgi:Putative membrane protein insertion efficiency factor